MRTRQSSIVNIVKCVMRYTVLRIEWTLVNLPIEIYTTNINPTKNMRTTERKLSMFEEIEFNEFKESKNIKAIANKITEARALANKFERVARSINNLVYQVEGDIDMIEVLADDKEIKALNEVVAVLTAKLEVFEDKKVIAWVEALATIFGITEKAAKVDKKVVAESLGL